MPNKKEQATNVTCSHLNKVGRQLWLELASASLNGQFLWRVAVERTAFDRNLLRQAGLANRYPEAQDAVLVAGLDLVRINRFGEGNHALESALTNLLSNPLHLFVLLHERMHLTTNRQRVLLHAQLHILRFDARQQHIHLIAALGLVDVHRSNRSGVATK